MPPWRLCGVAIVVAESSGSPTATAEDGQDRRGDGEVGDSPPEESRRPEPKGSRGVLRVLASARLAWAIAVLAVVAAVVFGLEAKALNAREAGRAEALQAAEVAALQLTTFTGATIDEWVEQTRRLATGAFAEEIAQRYDQQLRADLREFDVESVGEVLSSFVQEFDGDQSVAFVVLRQTTLYPTYEQTVEDEVRFEITLLRQGGDWLVSDAQLLSPTPPLTPRPFLEEAPPEGD